MPRYWLHYAGPDQDQLRAYRHNTSEGGAHAYIFTRSAGATDPHRSPSTADALKVAVRQSGLLDLLVARTRSALAAAWGSDNSSEHEAVSRFGTA